MGLLDDIADLVLSRACLGCDALGSPLCGTCAAALVPDALRVSAPVRGLPPVVAGLPHEGLAARAIVAHKERQMPWLTAALWPLLAAGLRLIASDPCVVVPVPPHASSLRRRGRDTVAELAAPAARSLGLRLDPCLSRTTAGPRQKSRTGRERRVGHTGTLLAEPGRGAAVVVDDVVTTGATAAEAVRALRERGWTVLGVATATAAIPRGGPQPGYAGAVPVMRGSHAPPRSS